MDNSEWSEEEQVSMRAKVDKATELNVITRCRRRCAICFGLHRDTRIRLGQIAHLNKNSSDNRLQNLVFLCLEHHDQFDSRTSQSKNFTLREVEQYRKELEICIESEWNKPVRFDAVSLIDIQKISGHYIWEAKDASAELDIKALGNNQVAVTGIAFCGIGNTRRSNIGEIDFNAAIIENKIHYVEATTGYEMLVDFVKGGVNVTEKNPQGRFGMNVTFAGSFKNITKEEADEVISAQLTITLEGGNLFMLEDNKEQQLTFVGADHHPIVLPDKKVVYIREEECIRPSLEPSHNYVTYHKKKIMSIDLITLFERVISDKKPYEDGQAFTNEILTVTSPTLSLNGQYLYFITEKWTTATQLVKVNVESGIWTELFPAASFELIKEGRYRGLFLIASSEIRGRGRNIYYKLCDEAGTTLKEFDTEETVIKFREIL